MNTATKKNWTFVGIIIIIATMMIVTSESIESSPFIEAEVFVIGQEQIDNEGNSHKKGCIILAIVLLFFVAAFVWWLCS